MADILFQIDVQDSHLEEVTNNHNSIRWKHGIKEWGKSDKGQSSNRMHALFQLYENQGKKMKRELNKINKST